MEKKKGNVVTFLFECYLLFFCSLIFAFMSNSNIYNVFVYAYFKGPPMIVSASKSLDQNITLSVLFCSSSEPDPIWLYLGTPIEKSTQMTQISCNTSLSIQVYNTTVMCTGYKTNLTLHFDMAGRFVVRLKNDFGEVRQSFLVDSKKTKGNAII